jgi:hypothetical protein
VQAVRFLHLPFNENWAKLLVWIGLAGLLTSALQAIARAIAVMLETASILGKGEPTQD